MCSVVMHIAFFCRTTLLTGCTIFRPFHAIPEREVALYAYLHVEGFEIWAMPVFTHCIEG